MCFDFCNNCLWLWHWVFPQSVPKMDDNQFCLHQSPTKTQGGPRKKISPYVQKVNIENNHPHLIQSINHPHLNQPITLILQNPHQQRRGRLAKSQSTGLKRSSHCLSCGKMNYQYSVCLSYVVCFIWNLSEDKKKLKWILPKLAWTSHCNKAFNQVQAFVMVHVQKRHIDRFM